MLHGVTSPKIFAVKDLWSRWAYLQCLVLLPEFWAKAPFELPSQAEAKYYECVLQADRPMDIPLDKTARHYARWLSGGVEAQADAAEEKVNGHALVFFPIVSFDDTAIEKAKPAKRAMARIPGQTSGGHFLSPLSMQQQSTPRTVNLAAAPMRRPWRSSPSGQVGLVCRATWPTCPSTSSRASLLDLSVVARSVKLVLTVATGPFARGIVRGKANAPGQGTSPKASTHATSAH